MAPTPSAASAAATASATSAVALPPRSQTNGKPAVWATAPDAGATTGDLASKCDQHNRERMICCRELKGSDERSLIDPDIVRDIIIGLADGLTVPFALTAGLSSLGSSRLVYVAGCAELFSGAISMGVGGYLSAQAERDHYRYLFKTTRERVLRSCSGEMEREVAAVLSPLGLDNSLSRRVAGALLSVESTLPPPRPTPSIMSKILKKIARGPKRESSPGELETLLNFNHTGSDTQGLTAFLLKHGEGLEEVSDARLFISAFTIGASYFIGGTIPLIPYFIFPTAREALYWSIGITTIVLLLFGAAKTYVTGAEVGARGYFYGCVSTLAVGGGAASASFAIVKALEGGGL